MRPTAPMTHPQPDHGARKGPDKGALGRENDTREHRWRRVVPFGFNTRREGDLRFGTSHSTGTLETGYESDVRLSE